MSDTNRKQDENYRQLLIHPQERLRLIEENVRDYAIFVVDSQGNIASWNVGAERLLGYTREEAFQMNCAEIFTPEDRAAGAVEKERAAAAETGRAVDERWHVRKDGSRFWGSGIMTGLRDEEGRLRGFVKILRDMTERKQAEEERARDQERFAAQELQTAVLEERNRIAQEIHDTLAQGFVGIAFQLDAAEEALTRSPEKARAYLARARDLARESLAEARRSVLALRPHILEAGDLVSALEHLLQQMTAGVPMKATFHLQGTPRALPPAVEADLYRIGQESLTNALRHGHADRIRMELTFAPQEVRLLVEDNGQGFDSQATPAGGFGLISMRERAERLGAQLTVTGSPGQGTTVHVIAPLIPTEADAGSESTPQG